MGCFIFLLITLLAFGMAIKAGERPSVIIGFIVLIIAEISWLYYTIFIDNDFKGSSSYRGGSYGRGSGLSKPKNRKSKHVSSGKSTYNLPRNYKSTSESKAYARGAKDAAESSAINDFAQDFSEIFEDTTTEKSYNRGYKDQLSGKTDIGNRSDDD